MLTLTCSSCQKKLSVSEDLTGKKVRCLHCKQTLDIPTRTAAIEPAKPSFAEDATVPPRPVSSNEDATVPPRTSAPAKTILLPQAERNGDVDNEESRESLEAVAHYEVEGEIARGGMGAIMRAVDQDIRREVAVKFLLNHADEKMKARFVEEAQITGQLEHPNIVPIHQLGVHPDGRCFFSMKMVKGQSLGEILKAQNEPRPSGSAGAYTLVRLLNIFVSICNAMAYAHSREVIHRDLKPANIMVGDFGEVYVMDWGLAKVLGKEEPPEPSAPATHIQRKKSAADMTQPGNPSGSQSGDKVTTNRQTVGGDLTQAGAIMGTPAYMPPEQATGDKVDQRADIYSLGAILYEIMTLTPPVGRGGDMMAILMRVVDGKIDPPAERAPERAKAGWVPPELAAIALKALATKRKNRYQTVETLKHDIELFLEGRSVSAKHDSFREMFWKLVKRNKGVSAATAAALVVLTVVLAVAFQINYSARLHAEQQQDKAEKAYAAFEKAQNDKEAAVRRAVPALVRAGRQLANENRIDLAEEQVRLALAYDAKNPDALLLKGQILIARKQWPAARAELEPYLRQRPRDFETILLMDAITKGKPDDGPTLLAVIESLQRQKVPGLAAPLLPDLEKIVAPKAKLVPVYQQQIEARWKGFGKGLSLAKDGEFRLTLSGQSQVVDLAPLQGMKLNWLYLADCWQIKDLAPLRGMPLHYLELRGCQMETLDPLRGMPLTSLSLFGCNQVADLEPLSGMKLTTLDLHLCSKVRDLGPLAGMQLESLVLSGNVLIDDLSPLRGQPLKTLSILYLSQISSLEPLQGMPLTKLNTRGLDLVKDLSPLRNMPLTDLDLYNCGNVSDLEPLRGMKLTYLNLGSSKRVENLEPLHGMPLTELFLYGTSVKNLEPLRGMPLKKLYLGAQIDLAPLEGLPLQFIHLTPKLIEKNIDVLRNMKSLTTIQVYPAANYTPAEFWARYDKGEFKK